MRSTPNTKHSPVRPFKTKEPRKTTLWSWDKEALNADQALDTEQACKILNETLRSELFHFLRYRHHEIATKGTNFPLVAAEFKALAENEETNMIMIAERINQLGGKADFNTMETSDRSFTETDTTSDLISMLREDLIAERIAIGVYKKLIQSFEMSDPTTRYLLEKILGDEETHARGMAELLSTVDRHQQEFHS